MAYRMRHFSPFSCGAVTSLQASFLIPCPLIGLYFVSCNGASWVSPYYVTRQSHTFDTFEAVEATRMSFLVSVFLSGYMGDIGSRKGIN
jgi:hypothetical protein